MSRVDLIVKLMKTAPAPKVRRVESEEGCFVNRTLREQTQYFLTWAARDKRVRP